MDTYLPNRQASPQAGAAELCRDVTYGMLSQRRSKRHRNLAESHAVSSLEHDISTIVWEKAMHQEFNAFSLTVLSNKVCCEHMQNYSLMQNPD